MLILSDFVDFESSVGYFINYKLVMSQYIIQNPPAPLASSNRKPHPIAKITCKGPGVPGGVGWLPASLIPSLFLFISFHSISLYYCCDTTASPLLHYTYCF